jgi:hypothetical protein
MNTMGDASRYAQQCRGQAEAGTGDLAVNAAGTRRAFRPTRFTTG